MRRADLPGTKSATFVLPRWRIAYVSVPKAACTSLKWLLADLQGERRQAFYDVVSGEVARSLMVHRRSRWRFTPTLHELSDDDLAEIDPDNGWFVFAAVRHPATRLWSAWQSKLLLRDPRFVSRYPEAIWPRVPTSTDDVLEDFATFVTSMGLDRQQALMHDRHFRRQSQLLAVGRMSYSRVYQTSELSQLIEDLTAHCSALGLATLPPLPTSNETPLAPIASAFPSHVQQIIEQHYGSDYSAFRFDHALPIGILDVAGYTARDLAEVGRLVERSERIGDLVKATRALQAQQARTSAALRSLRAQRHATLVRRTRRRLRRAARYVRSRVAGDQAQPRLAAGPWPGPGLTDQASGSMLRTARFGAATEDGSQAVQPGDEGVRPATDPRRSRTGLPAAAR